MLSFKNKLQEETTVKSGSCMMLFLVYYFKGSRGGGGGGGGGKGDNGEGWRLEDAIPGTPGEDYPTISIDAIPQTDFTCDNQVN